MSLDEVSEDDSQLPKFSPGDGQMRADIVDKSREGDYSLARAGLTHTSSSVRATAVRVLTTSNQITDNEINIASKGSVQERRALAEAGRFNSRINLVSLANDEDSSVVEIACFSLGERHQTPDEDNITLQQVVHSPPDEVLFETLCGIARNHSNNLCRESAVAALGAIGDERGREAILLATTDRATIRRRAVLALSNFAGPDVDEAIDRARDDRDWQVRQAAEDTRRNISG